MQNEAIKLGRQDLTEEEELTVLSRELKQRKDSLQEFEKAGREDLVEKIHTELTYVEAIYAGTTFRRRTVNDCYRNN